MAIEIIEKEPSFLSLDLIRERIGVGYPHSFSLVLLINKIRTLEKNEQKLTKTI